jgi:hypothetical protein
MHQGSEAFGAAVAIAAVVKLDQDLLPTYVGDSF